MSSYSYSTARHLVNYSNNCTKLETNTKCNNDCQKLNGVNLAKPEIWGPCLWLVLHIGSLNYPKEANNLCKERMKGFILGVPFIISCQNCADHCSAYIDLMTPNLDNIVSYRDNLFKFFVDLHNYVNKRLSKPEMSMQQALKLYSNPVDMTMLKIHTK